MLVDRHLVFDSAFQVTLGKTSSHKPQLGSVNREHEGLLVARLVDEGRLALGLAQQLGNLFGERAFVVRLCLSGLPTAIASVATFCLVAYH